MQSVLFSLYFYDFSFESVSKIKIIVSKAKSESSYQKGEFVRCIMNPFYWLVFVYLNNRIPSIMNNLLSFFASLSLHIMMLIDCERRVNFLKLLVYNLMHQSQFRQIIPRFSFSSIAHWLNCTSPSHLFSQFIIIIIVKLLSKPIIF